MKLPPRALRRHLLGTLTLAALLAVAGAAWADDPVCVVRWDSYWGGRARFPADDDLVKLVRVFNWDTDERIFVSVQPGQAAFSGRAVSRGSFLRGCSATVELSVRYMGTVQLTTRRDFPWLKEVLECSVIDAQQRRHDGFARGDCWIDPDHDGVPATLIKMP